jgi:hypothetical protein
MSIEEMIVKHYLDKLYQEDVLTYDEVEEIKQKMKIFYPNIDIEKVA